MDKVCHKIFNNKTVGNHNFTLFNKIITKFAYNESFLEFIFQTCSKKQSSFFYFSEAVA